jgi:hypothetical protein
MSSNCLKSPKGTTIGCLFFILCCVNIGCESKISSVEFIPTQIYEFSEPRNIGRDRVFMIENIEDIEMIHPQVDNNLIIINYLKNKKSETIHINSNLLWDNFYYLNKDSIFLINRYNGLIYLVNSKSELIDNWQVPLQIDSVQYTIYIARQCDLYVKNSEMYLKIIGVSGDDYIYNYYISMIYDLKFHKIKRIYMKYPAVYTTTHNWSNVGCIVTTTYKSPNQIFYNFPMYENIISYSLINNETKEIHLPRSKYIKDFPPPIFANNWKELRQSYIRTYWIDKPSYQQLIFDKYRNLFYRIVYHSQPLNDSSGNYNDDFTRNWSIMVFDESFKFINEQFFEGRKYQPFFTFVTSDGLIIPFHDRYQNNNSNGITYQLFKIKKDVK